MSSPPPPARLRHSTTSQRPHAAYSACSPAASARPSVAARPPTVTHHVTQAKSTLEPPSPRFGSPTYSTEISSASVSSSVASSTRSIFNTVKGVLKQLSPSHQGLERFPSKHLNSPQNESEYAASSSASKRAISIFSLIKKKTDSIEETPTKRTFTAAIIQGPPRQRRQSVPHIHIGASNLKDGNIKQKISSRNPSDTPSPLNLFDKEGPLFNTTIYEASMRAGKNGIPDIVIQCVEYLVRMGYLNSEGLYRIPGNMRRVAILCIKFQDACIHKVDGDTIATPQLKRSSEVKSSRRGSVTELIHSEGIGAAAGIQRRQTVSSRVDQLQVPEPTAISDVSDCSHFAISGSNAELVPTETTKTVLSTNTTTTTTTSNIKKFLITIPFVESKRGVGLWDDEGIFGTVGFPFQLELETPGTVASLLKKYLSSIKGGFVPDGFWKEMDEIAKVCGVVQPPTTPIIEQIKTLIQDKFPSKQHIHTFAYFLLHLQQVASYADTNFMTPRNLVLCIFISAGDGGELLIRHADVVFGNVDLVGRETVALLPKLEEQEVKAVAYMSLNRSLNRADSDGCLFLDKWFKSHMTYDPRQELLQQQQQQQQQQASDGKD